MTNILLIILIALWIFIYRKQFLLFFSSPRKQHFLERLQNIERQIWDKEFQKFQTQEMRENIRLDMDRQNEAVDAFQVELKKPDHKPDTVALLEGKMAQAKANAERFLAQIKMLDNEVLGVPYLPGTNDTPEQAGQQGLNDTIASLSEVRKMFKLFIKKL